MVSGPCFVLWQNTTCLTTKDIYSLAMGFFTHQDEINSIKFKVHWLLVKLDCPK